MQKQTQLYKIWVVENAQTNKVYIFDSKNNPELSWKEVERPEYIIGSIDYAIEEDFSYIKKQLQNIINNYKHNPNCPISQSTSSEYIRFFSMGYEFFAKQRGDY